MRLTGPGRVIFGLSIAALGACNLFIRGFALVWPTVPKWMPWHDPMAMLFAALLFVGGVLVLVPRTARSAAFGLAIVLLVQMVLLRAHAVITHPLVEGVWEDTGEHMVFVAGAWTIFSLLPADGGAQFGNVRAGQILFALALIPFGLAHFFYLNLTAPLIPSWLPFHVPLAYFTGAAYIAGGLAILSGVLARLAATLVAVMVSLFTLVVWVPIVIKAPGTLGDWSEIFVSAAITGAAWAVAESLGDRPWGFARST